MLVSIPTGLAPVEQHRQRTQDTHIILIPCLPPRPLRLAENPSADAPDDWVAATAQEEALPDVRSLSSSSSSSTLRHGQWHTLDYRGVGHTVLELDLNEKCATHVRVTEVGRLGSRFRLWDGPEPVGLTSSGSSSSGGNCGDDPEACSHFEAASAGDFVLVPGPHQVRLKVASASFHRGTLAIRIDSEQCPATSRRLTRWRRLVSSSSHLHSRRVRMHAL